MLDISHVKQNLYLDSSQLVWEPHKVSQDLGFLQLSSVATPVCGLDLRVQNGAPLLF